MQIVIIVVDTLFLSTLSLRRATDLFIIKSISYSISIHALLAESDDYFSAVMRQNPGISIHALLAESDLAGPSGPAFLYNFYPRSPCGERLTPPIKRPESVLFLSTLSLRRATIPLL